ncbi:MAG TPA: efflux RND transporter periplasmic adaptor subunit [Anaeromyxobacter sp.]|nr:efflux RND transporter periplasmic adaptor subunit [Anaeromyxobacter sp.]
MAARPPKIALVAALAAALAGTSTACSKGDAKGAGGPRAVPVRAVPAVEKAVPVEVRAVGKIVSSESVAVRAQVSGTLVAAHFKEGQAVRKGDLLLEIDRRPFQAALSEASARLLQDRARAENARADASRYRELLSQSLVPPQQYEAAKANADALEAQVAADEATVERARLNLAYAAIRAPISGRTGRLLVHVGNLVSMGAPEQLLTIEQVRPVYAEFAVPERHLAAVRERRDAPPAVAVRTSASAAPVTGTLAFVNNAVDAGTGTILLKARIANEDEALWPGQLVDVSVRVSERAKAVVVPASAVASGQQGDYAYVVGPDQKAQVRQVVVEQAGENEVVVVKGLAAGEVVVTEGHLRIRPGAMVEVMEGDGRGARAPGKQVEGRAPPG